MANLRLAAIGAGRAIKNLAARRYIFSVNALEAVGILRHDALFRDTGAAKGEDSVQHLC